MEGRSVRPRDLPDFAYDAFKNRNSVLFGVTTTFILNIKFTHELEHWT